MNACSVEYSIILPAYNEAEELPATLAAVLAAMRAQGSIGECLVVDNNSNDATAEVAAGYEGVSVVFEPFNQIARARNAGAEASLGQYLIFIDADTRIEPELLSQSLKLLRAQKHVGGGAIIQFEGEISALGRFGIGLWERISKITKVAAGSYLFCRRDAFEAVGGFDEKLYASEEVRLSRLIKDWGRKHEMQFTILDHSPARTSARKLRWYSGPQILGWVVFMMLMPIAVRYRSLCGFWYKRPA
ncbi:MAG: glycosyltransferase [Lentimonas sp.]